MSTVVRSSRTMCLRSRVEAHLQKKITERIRVVFLVGTWFCVFMRSMPAAATRATLGCLVHLPSPSLYHTVYGHSQQGQQLQMLSCLFETVLVTICSVRCMLRCAPSRSITQMFTHALPLAAVWATEEKDINRRNPPIEAVNGPPWFVSFLALFSVCIHCDPNHLAHHCHTKQKWPINEDSRPH